MCFSHQVSNSIQLPSLCIWTSSLLNKQNIREKNDNKMRKKLKVFKNKREGIKNLVMEAAVHLSNSCCKSHGPYISTCKSSLQRIIGLARGLSLHYMFNAGPQLSLPSGLVFSQCCGDGAALGPLIRYFQVLLLIIKGMDIGAGQVIIVGLGLGS